MCAEINRRKKAPPIASAARRLKHTALEFNRAADANETNATKVNERMASDPDRKLLGRRFCIIEQQSYLIFSATLGISSSDPM